MIPPNIIDQIADERDELRDENKRLKHRIEFLESANSDVDRIAKERDDALMMLGMFRLSLASNRLEDALRRIANTDYRGNRLTASQIAAEALESKP
jgi:hypothetical protein